MSNFPLLNIENPVFKSFLYYSSILSLKLLFMSSWTAVHRIYLGIVPTPEDVVSKRQTVGYHPKIERIRRAHRNDLENILLFFVSALAFTITDPNEWVAINLMKLFTWSRLLHTFVYAVVPIPQPARGAACVLAYLAQIYIIANRIFRSYRPVLTLLVSIPILPSIVSTQWLNVFPISPRFSHALFEVVFNKFAFKPLIFYDFCPRAIIYSIRYCFKTKALFKLPRMSQTFLSLENELFRSYLFYSSLLSLKVLSVALLTARKRIAKNIFAAPEDLVLGGSRAKVKYDDPDIERTRRAHLNDLENIPVFIVAAFCYLMTNPSPSLALTLIRLFTLARFVHTFVYAVVVIPQPSRAICHLVGFGITIYMAISALIAFS